MVGMARLLVVWIGLMSFVCAVTLLAQRAAVMTGDAGATVRMAAFVVCSPLMWRSFAGLQLLSAVRAALGNSRFPELLMRLLSVLVVFEVAQVLARVLVAPQPSELDAAVQAGATLCMLSCCLLFCEPGGAGRRRSG